jgi:uncharacterized iron-regulated membrane protein
MMGLLRLLHAWVGAGLALILIVIGLTGALLVFKGDFVRLTVPEARAEADANPADLGRAADRLEHVLHGDLEYVVFASERLGVHQATFTRDRYAYADAAGDVVAAWRGAGRPEAFVYELHHFLLAGETGMKVVGWSGLIAGGLAIVGLILWIPVWKSFSLKLWPRAARRSELLRSHRNLGVIFALPALLFCLTGAGLIFYQTTESLLARLLPGAAPEEFFPPSDEADVDWPTVLAAAQTQFPQATIRAAIWPAGPWDAARVRLRQPGEWRFDGGTTVLIDPSTNIVRGVINSRQLGPGYRLNAALQPLHIAAVGGRLYDAAAFLSGLALAALGGFGLWSFLLKPRRRAPRP